MRSNISKIDSLKVSISTFKLEYNYLPGDMPNAFSYWGTNCAATNTLCDGNGNRTVVWLSTEQYRVWQHLSLANLLEGQYTGVQGSTLHSVPGSNSPVMPIKDSVINIIDANVFTSRGLYLYFARSGPTNPTANSGLLSPSDAYNIDYKVDDGMPGTGKIQSMNGWTPTTVNGNPQLTGCTSSNGTQIPATSTFSIQNTNTNCIMAFFLDHR